MGHDAGPRPAFRLAYVRPDRSRSSARHHAKCGAGMRPVTRCGDCDRATQGSSSVRSLGEVWSSDRWQAPRLRQARRVARSEAARRSAL